MRPDAQFNPGVVCAQGQAVPKDLVQKWFSLAGDPEAVKYRDVVTWLITHAQIVEVQKLAREWKPTTQLSQ